MKATHTNSPGAYLIRGERTLDERGYLDVSFDAMKFMKLQKSACLVWDRSIIAESGRGVIRGLHYQVMPLEERKLIKCVRGAIFDVLLDLRRDYPSYGQTFYRVMSDLDNEMLFVPEGVAHGYQALCQRTCVHYLIKGSYSPALARGVVWNDPSLKIPWPVDEFKVSTRDANFPPFNP